MARGIEESWKARVLATGEWAVGRLGAAQRDFALGRFSEGVRTRAYLERRYPEVFDAGSRILDIGCGDGGLILPFSTDGRYRCVGIEVVPRRIVAEFRSPALAHLVARGESLPFRDASLDAVLLVETIEHVHAASVGAEISRALRPGGICYITTPARVRHSLTRDPHYRVPGLLLLPDRLQRRLVEFLLPGISYEVTHLFWSVSGIRRSIPGTEIAEVTSRHPWVRGALRGIDWDWIVLRRRS